jgi:hypothetical protein
MSDCSYTAAQAIYILRVGDMITTIFLEYGFTSNNTLRSFSIIACEFDYRGWNGVLDASLWQHVYQLHVHISGFDPDSRVTFTNITYNHETTGRARVAQ